jgi:hypothetical protein
MVLAKKRLGSMQNCFFCSGNQVLVLISVRTNTREPDIDSVFDPGPETGVVQPDPARSLRLVLDQLDQLVSMGRPSRA